MAVQATRVLVTWRIVNYLRSLGSVSFAVTYPLFVMRIAVWARRNFADTIHSEWRIKEADESKPSEAILNANHNQWRWMALHLNKHTCILPIICIPVALSSSPSPVHTCSELCHLALTLPYDLPGRVAVCGDQPSRPSGHYRETDGQPTSTLQGALLPRATEGVPYRERHGQPAV